MNSPLDDERPDAFLRAALRHAPDREAAPPAALDAQILAAARAAVRAAAHQPWWRVLAGQLAAALGALARPAPAAALASLMLATVIGVMWRDGPPPDRPAASDAPAAAPATATAPTAAPAAPPAAAPVDRAAAPALPARVPPKPRPRVDAPAESKAVPPPAPATVADVSPDATGRAAPAGNAAAASPAPVALADRAPEPAPEQRARESAEDDRSRRLSKQADAGPRAEASALRAAAPVVADPLAALSRALAVNAARDDPALAWLTALRRWTQGGWSLVPSAGDTGQTLTAADGRVLGRLAIQDEQVLWQPADLPGQAWRAALPVGRVDGLRRDIADWAAPPARP